MARVPEMKFAAVTEPANPANAPSLSGKSRFDLAGKNAIVTGAARGIGFAIARGLLQHGLSKVALIDIDGEAGLQALQILQAEFSVPNDCIVFQKLDISDEAAVNSVVTEISLLFGRIDILAHFAGIVFTRHCMEYTAEEFRRTLDINATGSFIMAQAVAKDMISHRHGGSIILTASMSGSIVNYPQVHAAYGTSKAAVLHLTRLMAAELAVHKIRVNSISPGYMDTRLNAGEDLTDVWKTWWERTPMGRIGNPEELVGPVVLLASEAGSFMTGSDVKVDGGYCLT